MPRTRSNQYDAAILSLMYGGEPFTPNEIAAKLGIHQHTAQAAMVALMQAGHLHRKTFGRYFIFWWGRGAPAPPTRGVA